METDKVLGLWHKLAAMGCVGLVAMLLAAGAASVAAQSPNLAGTWRGGGTVAFKSGAREQARCTATFTPQGGSTFAMNATCATQDGKVRQSATLGQIAVNRFVGDFTNTEFGISGTIRVTVQGSSLAASLSSNHGSAQLSFSR